MDKLENGSFGSPYLQRPLRSLDEVLRDQGKVAPRDENPCSAPLGQAAQSLSPKEWQADRLLSLVRQIWPSQYD
jgi:hypothetical protein